MPEPQSATVKVRMPDGSQWSIPRENLIRAKARGAVEVPEEKKTSFLTQVETELGKGLGFDVERIQRYGGASEGKQMLEAANQFMKGGAKWMERSAKDPVHLADPIYDLVTNIKNADVGVWKALTEDDASLRNLALRLARLTGAVAPAIGGASGGEGVKGPVRAIAKIPEKVMEAPKGAARELIGATEKDVERARRPVEQKAEELRAAHKEKVSKAIAEHGTEKIEQSKVEGQRASLEAVQERYAKQVAENLDKAERMEKLSLDSEWQDFRARVLGVSKEAPNGTLQSNLTAVGKAVLEAKKAIVKGSDTNIPIFKDLMGRFSEMVDTPEGAVPLEGQTIPTDQLRGYIRELDDKIYGSNLPSDVRNAMKHVSEVANKEVESAIEDVHGKAAKRAYENLKDRYSDYMETWNDKSSGSPVVKIKSLLREPISTRRGVPVYREVADVLRSKDGEKIIATLARKRAFGADTSTIAKLRSAAEKLKELPKPKEVGKFEAPKAPDIEHFNVDEFVEKAAESRAKSLARWGTIGAIAWAVRDLVHGQVPSPMLLAAPAAQHVLSKLLTSPKFLKWVTEGLPKGGTV